MEGSIIAAGEGDRRAALRYQEMARALIERHRPYVKVRTARAASRPRAAWPPPSRVGRIRRSEPAFERVAVMFTVAALSGVLGDDAVQDCAEVEGGWRDRRLVGPEAQRLVLWLGRIVDLDVPAAAAGMRLPDDLLVPRPHVFYGGLAVRVAGIDPRFVIKSASTQMRNRIRGSCTFITDSSVGEQVTLHQSI